MTDQFDEELKLIKKAMQTADCDMSVVRAWLKLYETDHCHEGQLHSGKGEPGRDPEICSKAGTGGCGRSVAEQTV